MFFPVYRRRAASLEQALTCVVDVIRPDPSTLVSTYAPGLFSGAPGASGAPGVSGTSGKAGRLSGRLSAGLGAGASSTSTFPAAGAGAVGATLDPSQYAMVLRNLATQMGRESVVADDTPGREVKVPLVELLAGEGGILPTHLEESPEVCYCVLRVVRYLCRYGVSTTDKSSEDAEMIETFARKKGFLDSLLFIMNKHQLYQHVMEQAVWCIAIFAPYRVKKFLTMRTVRVVMHNASGTCTHPPALSV
jgi:hypothetical protein